MKGEKPIYIFLDFPFFFPCPFLVFFLFPFPFIIRKFLIKINKVQTRFLGFPKKKTKSKSKTILLVPFPLTWHYSRLPRRSCLDLAIFSPAGRFWGAAIHITAPNDASLALNSKCCQPTSRVGIFQ